METSSLNFGCALISTAPVFAAHLVLAKQVRYMLLSWFCSFVSTVILIICSLSSLFTKNPYIILAYSVPLDCLGKILLKFFGCRVRFLSNPKDRCYLGMSCGLGFALAHVLTMYLPFCFDQPYSIEFDNKHPDYFPNCLDLALLNHAISFFHIAVGLFIFRFSEINIFLMYFIIVALQFGIGAMTQIPIIWIKQILVNFVSYVFLMLVIYSFKGMKYSIIRDDDEIKENLTTDANQNDQRSPTIHAPVRQDDTHHTSLKASNKSKLDSNDDIDDIENNQYKEGF